MKYKVVKKIVRKGYPTASPRYSEAHAEADQAEKKTNPGIYKALKKVDAKLKPHELIGTHSKAGKIEIEKKVPAKDRQDVALHEFVEWKADKRLCKHCKKTKRAHQQAGRG